jgi:hypothetical protein
MDEKTFNVARKHNQHYQQNYDCADVRSNSPKMYDFINYQLTVIGILKYYYYQTELLFH